jgi:exo-beta-1,3-glucanase (GH17 family)
MNSKPRIKTNLSGVDFSGKSSDDLKAMFIQILKSGIHGISFSPYTNDQRPGMQLSESIIRNRMEIIRPYVSWVRSFSCTEGNELIPKVAKEMGLNTLVGAWLGDEADKNEMEINGLLNLAREGNADILAVGNEVLLRGELTEDQIVDYIRQVQSEVPDLPVGYVDAYYEFELHPKIVEACDVLLVNLYPFWEGYPFEHSLVYLKDMYRRALRAANGKKVIVAETGWPNQGAACGNAVPSFENAIKYFINIYNWAAEEGVEVFYFSSFDEAWKIDKEGDVGAFWGLWDQDGNLKYS